MFSSCENEIRNKVFVIAEEMDLRVLYAVKYAETISGDVVVFGTFGNDEDERNLQLRWSKIKSNIPLVLRASPDGGIVGPLLDTLRSPEYGIGADETVTVVLPRLVVTRWWHRLLHNQTSQYMERRLSEYKQIKVKVVPIQLEDDDSKLGVAAPS